MPNINDCLFCQIAHDPEKLVWESETVAVFKDIHPQAPVHVLLMPKKHITSLADTEEDDRDTLGDLLLAVKKVAKSLQIDESGYRVIINTRDHGGQMVDHLHLHLLGGEVIGPLRART